MSAAAGGVTVPLAVRTGDEVPVRIPRLPAREAAERELSEPPYHQNDPSLFQRALDRFWEWLDTLFDAAAGVTPGGPAGLAVILAVVVLLAVALRLRLGPLRRTRNSPGGLFDDLPRSGAEHRAEAERHAAAQRWEQAVQERTRALVRSLEERALLTPRPGRTADEAATEAGGPLPAHADRLRAAARDFDDVTYGGRRTTAETYARLRELDEEIRYSKPVLAPVPAGDPS